MTGNLLTGMELSERSCLQDERLRLTEEGSDMRCDRQLLPCLHEVDDMSYRPCGNSHLDSMGKTSR
jgi:hypothetical protein